MRKYLLSCTQRTYFGADPEFFFTRNGKIIPSSEVIPEEGIVTTKANSDYLKRQDLSPMFVRDGVQAEYHPAAATCRGNAIDAVKVAFVILKGWIPDDVRLSFETTVEIPEEDFAALPAECRRLGCQPSLSIYGDNGLGVDPETYRFRSAGGHIHLGGLGSASGRPKEELIGLLDIIVGNTSVLLDRDPLVAFRRQVYGRAGEWRDKPYGVEYRTLTNFWLRSPELMGLIYGLCRICTDTWIGGSKYNMATGRYDTVEYEGKKDLIAAIDMEAIRTAINESNFDLALANWQIVRAWLNDNLPDVPVTTGACHPLGPNNLNAFDYLVEKGIDNWWPGRGHEVYERICNQAAGHGGGWEYWAYNVAQDAKRHFAEKEKVA